ncbi:hypothetical protein [Haliea sp. E17]|uniref:hypothetical protein n=1 Tax=Haliea sp. E17 TaxID=3401576 RepID=UPI003AAA6488
MILPLAVANGALRELVLVPAFGETRALAASGICLCVLVVAVAYVFLPWMGLRRGSRLLAAGILWLILTLLFDLVFGLARGMPLSATLDAYRPGNGNLWPLVLVFITFAPYLAARMRGIVR